MDLNGAVGNGGLRQRICHALAKQGAHIAVVYAQSRDQAEAVARELTSTYQINAAALPATSPTPPLCKTWSATSPTASGVVPGYRISRSPMDPVDHLN